MGVGFPFGTKRRAGHCTAFELGTMNDPRYAQIQKGRGSDEDGRRRGAASKRRCLKKLPDSLRTGLNRQWQYGITMVLA